MISTTNIKYKLLPLLVILVSFAVIFYQFPNIPQNLAFDEVDFAQLTDSLRNQPYTPYSPLATGHATLYFYLMLASFDIFGVSAFSLRLPAAFFGVIDTFLFYLILRKFFSQIKIDTKNEHITYLSHYIFPFTLALIFTTMRWYFHFARFAFESTFLLFFELAAIYALLEFVEKKKLWLLLLSGFLTGLAYNSYTPGRLFIALPVFFIVAHYLQWKIFTKKAIITLIAFLIPYAIAIAPLSLYLSQNQDTRIYQQFYPMNHGLSIETRLGYFWHNLSTNILMLHVKGDVNGRHNYPNKPIINPLLGLLLIGGVIITLKDIKKFRNQFFISYFLLGLLPTLMTYPWENPNMLRIHTTIPAVVYFIGNGLHWLLIKKLSLKTHFVIIILSGIILFSAVYELRTYFKYQTQVFPESFEMRGDLKKLIKIELKR